jgi:hypothetical protein
MGRASAIRRSGLCGRGTFVLKVSALRAPSLSDRSDCSVPRCGRPDTGIRLSFSREAEQYAVAGSIAHIQEVPIGWARPLAVPAD